MFSERTSWNLAPNRFALAVERHRHAGRPILDLTASNPTEIGLSYDRQILAALSRPEALSYRPDPRGLLAARETVCGYYAARAAELSPEQLVLTTSTSEAYSFVFRLLANSGDEVLVPTPSYPLFDFLAGLQDVVLRPYSLFYDHGWQIDFGSVRERITARSRAILLVHPNNPTGSFVKPSEWEQLNALCAEHELALIADEVFLDFAQPAVAFQALARSFVENQQALTFALSGLSKIAGLPQMKFAWIAVSGPESLRKDALSRLEIISDTYLSMNTPVQLAAPEFFASRMRFQGQLNARIAANLSELDRQLRSQSLASRLEIEAGWYAILRVSALRSDEEVTLSLLENYDLLVHPGHFYDFPSEGFLVVSLIAPEKDFQVGIGRMLSVVSG